MAAKNALLDKSPEELIANLIKEVYISGDDFTALKWA